MYDEEKRVLEKRFNGEGAIIPGHSSRVFCVKFDKTCLIIIIWNLFFFKHLQYFFQGVGILMLLYGILAKVKNFIFYF